ncbi:MAG: TetR/AcrR family transcriptional regulator [Ignavibacteriales bacterium]|nr:MAG: TetR/AcrR family transcriptional regulator [Ignavibacteriales bacterium]
MEEDKIKIMKYALDKFFREGFYKVTMDQLAAELRMSKKTIYKYFPSKEFLVQETVEFMKGYISASIIKIIDSNDNAVVKIVALVKVITDLWMNVKEKMLVELERHYPKIWQGIDEFRVMMMNRNLSKLFEQGKKEGLIKDYPSEIVRTVFMGAVRAVVNPDFFVNNQLSLNNAVEMTFEIMLNGLLTEKGKEIFFESKSGIDQ